MLLTVDEVPSDEQIAQLEAIGGIYNVRVVRL
jgi:hypothetical protein